MLCLSLVFRIIFATKYVQSAGFSIFFNFPSGNASNVFLFNLITDNVRITEQIVIISYTLYNWNINTTTR